MTTIQLEHFKQWIERAAEQILAKKEYLTSLDQAIGDGDHGINLARGINEVLSKMNHSTYFDIGAFLQDIAMVLLSKVGGASGPLYATAFMKMAVSLKGKTEISVQELSFALKEATNGIKSRGKAEIKQKTLLDVWEPVTLQLLEMSEMSGIDIDWMELIKITETEMEKTKEMEAIKGRASYLGKRSVGHLDPGAVSSFYLFESLFLTLMEEK